MNVWKALPNYIMTIVDYSAALYRTLPLGTGEVFRRKNSSEISSKMEHIKAHNLPSFQTLNM